MKVFSGFPELNCVHTNRAFAIGKGLPDAVTQGMQTYAYLLEMLVTHFGRDWHSSGRVAVNFVKMVLPADTVTARGTVIATEAVNDRTRLRLEVWVENQHRVKVVVGEASVVV
jgi:acyl dehydratase